MKKIINVIFLVVLLILLVLLFNSYLKLKDSPQTEEPTQDYVTEDLFSGFERHEDLAYAFVDTMLDGNCENLLNYMNDDMLAYMASENYVNIESLKSAITSTYRREFSYYSEWLYDSFDYPTATYWNVSEMYWSEDDEFQELQTFEDYELGIGGYDYCGLKRDGATSLLYYRVSIDVTDTYDTDYYGFEFFVTQFDGLWYLVGID